MDPIKSEKLQAMMNNYKKSQFFNNLILYSLTALTCSLFCSYPFWFPSLCSSLEHFVLVSIPNFRSSIFNPKCLFVVGNVIVVFLVGESKLAGSRSSPDAEIIYNEHLERSRSFRGHSSTLEEKKEEGILEMNLIEESVNRVEEEKGKEEKEEEEKDGDGVGEGDEKEGDEAEEPDLPVEELNKRVEDFIARVNKQRWLEAKLL